MAKSIIWSKEASEDLIQILDYWNERNKSTEFSIKLYNQINDTIALVIHYPVLGRKTDFGDIKNIRAGVFLIFFRDLVDCIRIIAIWDNRQHPKKLIDKLK